MTTTTQFAYEFTYRGYTIVQVSSNTFAVLQNGNDTGLTNNLIDLIKKIDQQWDGKN